MSKPLFKYDEAAARKLAASFQATRVTAYPTFAGYFGLPIMADGEWYESALEKLRTHTQYTKIDTRFGSIFNDECNVMVEAEPCTNCEKECAVSDNVKGGSN